mmetsp:Transcript_70829/g.165885  ORF Transcript_70829/g.165885 Transcript_70829/m.165885 type:complete len:241 (+) Transcript_70829:184-906(+)
MMLRQSRPPFLTELHIVAFACGKRPLHHRAEGIRRSSNEVHLRLGDSVKKLASLLLRRPSCRSVCLIKAHLQSVLLWPSWPHARPLLRGIPWFDQESALQGTSPGHERESYGFGRPSSLRCGATGAVAKTEEVALLASFQIEEVRILHGSAVVWYGGPLDLEVRVGQDRNHDQSQRAEPERVKSAGSHDDVAFLGHYALGVKNSCRIARSIFGNELHEHVRWQRQLSGKTNGLGIHGPPL